MTTTATGAVELCVPADWAEILLPGREEAEAYFDRLARATWPNGPDEIWARSTEVLRGWRLAMLRRGVVSHGIVSAPRSDGALAQWQVMTSVVALPAAPDLDLTAVLAEVFREQGHGLRHLETFETDMGLGVGIVGEREVLPPSGLGDLAARGLPVVEEPIRVGTAAALACAPGGVHGLLVVGVCLAPDQVAELAGLVAVIAGRSRVHVPTGSDEEEDEA